LIVVYPFGAPGYEQTIEPRLTAVA